MHRQIGRAITVFLGAAALSFGADHGLLNLVGPDAQFVAGLQVDQAKSSTFGQFLLKQMSGTDPEMAKFIQDAGFDPKKDLREVVIAGSNDHKADLAMVRGTFDITKISALARRENAPVSKYQGYDVIESKQGSLVAFAENSIAVMGDSASVKAALGRRQSAANLMAKSLMDQIDQVSGANDLWFVANTMPAMGGTPAQAGPLQALAGVQSASGGIRLGSTILLSVNATARSEKDASALADVVRMFSTMPNAQSQSGTTAKKAPFDMTQAQINAQGSVVHVALPVSEPDVENWMQQTMQPKVHTPAPAPRRRQSHASQSTAL